ncbi:MAG: hypothetical protein KGZ32_05670 [Dethiobacter sp.]|jgi:uncharacterized membrane protein|nr:hypothetical protein [Dethiobacter sp.]
MICLRCGEDVKKGYPEGICHFCGAARRYPASNGGGSTSTGINERTAALLSYLAGWVTGIIFFVLESNKFVRFHAMQSMITFGSISILLMLLDIVRQIFWALSKTGVAVALVFFSLLGLLSTLLWIGMLILWVILMVKAHQGETFQLPIAGKIAERQL